MSNAQTKNMTEVLQVHRKMRLLAQVANLTPSEELPENVYVGLKNAAAEAAVVLSAMAKEHLGYTIGDAIIKCTCNDRLLVTGFCAPEKSESLYVETLTYKKDGTIGKKKKVFNAVLTATRVD